MYDVQIASSKPCETENLIGDTRRGGSCNFEEYRLITHCNGTHTECIGHITNERIAVTDVLKDVLMPALLVTVEPESAIVSGEKYPSELDAGDRMITRRSLDFGLRTWDFGLGSADSALIIRTTPNDESKKTRRYMQNPPPFFSNDAQEFIVETGFKHLLTDLPSIDRMFDEGKLSNHRIFWKVEPGSFEVNEQSRLNSTITEMIYVPDEIKDGEYILNLQIAPFASDAAPSRPLLFKV
jgi:kynurenine formamidase